MHCLGHPPVDVPDSLPKEMLAFQGKVGLYAWEKLAAATRGILPEVPQGLGVTTVGSIVYPGYSGKPGRIRPLTLKLIIAGMQKLGYPPSCAAQFASASTDTAASQETPSSPTPGTPPAPGKDDLLGRGESPVHRSKAMLQLERDIYSEVMDDVLVLDIVIAEFDALSCYEVMGAGRILKRIRNRLLDAVNFHIPGNGAQAAKEARINGYLTDEAFGDIAAMELAVKALDAENLGCLAGVIVIIRDTIEHLQDVVDRLESREAKKAADAD